MHVASPSIRRIERLNYGIAGVAVLVGALTQPQGIALGLAIGAGLTCLNFYVLRRLVTRWTADAAKGKPSNASLLMLPKMIALMGAVAVSILLLPIDPIAFAIGYSIFLLSILIESLYSAMKSPDDEAAPPHNNEHGHG
jgi:ATP synthase I chain